MVRRRADRPVPRLRLGKLKEEDIPQAMELKDSFGWNQLPEDWRRYLRISPKGCFGAKIGDRLVGTAIVFLFGRIAWMSLVAVRKDFQRRGIGAALMERGLEYSESEGIELVKLDATEEGTSLYRRFGFREEYPVGMARARVEEVRPFGGREAPETGIRRMEAEDLGPVVALDREACGVDRESLIEQLFRDYPGWGLISETDRPSGFVLFRPGSHSFHIGPLAASTEGQARALLDAVTARIAETNREAELRLSMSLQNPRSVRIFSEGGFQCTPRLVRMKRGSGGLHCREQMIYAYSGPEKG